MRENVNGRSDFQANEDDNKKTRAKTARVSMKRRVVRVCYYGPAPSEAKTGNTYAANIT